MKKRLIIISLLISTITLSQQANPFEIIFSGKTEKITKENILDIYTFIIDLDKSLKKEKKIITNYDIDYRPLLKNKRLNELGNILNDIKNNLKTQIVCENENNYLKLESKFTASNCGSLDLRNYCIEIVNSNINIDNSSLISNLGIFDYSNNKKWKEIHGGLEYKFKILDENKNEIKLDIVLKAFSKSNYKILSRKDIGKFLFTNKSIKLINLSNNHIALDIIDISNPLIFPYKDGKISNFKGIHTFPLYKSLYEYLISEKDITIEKLSTRFPLEIFKKLNTKGTYKIILPETSIGNEIIIFQKKYKKMELNVEQKL